MTEIADGARPRATLWQVFFTFLKIGTTSFGGSTQPFTYREVVERRGWLTDREFFTGVTVALVLPGANPVNVALYIGLQLRGGVGATLAVVGLVFPAWIMIMLLGFVYSTISGYDVTHVVLTGMAAVGVGSTLQLGAKAARRMGVKILPALVAIAMFAMVGPLRWPLIPVVVIGVPISVLIAWWTNRSSADA